ncbi:hypothetical protein OHA72_36635 [Dactylosporangium sp. NBC_01737]|uniref:hypothetical protein n=1 Tax=Dactylosporangium sp. NBC_01737 TaxID=2975959 RepID=UPI002E165EFD|nr:hypothetical protein OHA72_36635 [Dactylosporangium sp. NBC_01737]
MTGRTPITTAAVDLARAISRRHTDRRPVSEAPVPTADLDTIVAAARAEAGLHMFTPSQVLDLATAACRAAAVQADEPSARAELQYWTGPAAPHGAGIPAEALPEHLPTPPFPAGTSVA